jgi:hypothetical protein
VESIHAPDLRTDFFLFKLTTNAELNMYSKTRKDFPSLFGSNPIFLVQRFKSKSELSFSGQMPYQNLDFQVIEKDTEHL